MRHCECIADPSDIPLYRETGSLTKGNTTLPVYRCARGSNSLESFHLHVNLMIPSNSMNAVNMQALLSDGLVRWNSDRAAEAFGKPTIRSSDIDLVEKVKGHSQKVFGASVDIAATPNCYTGELFGVEYLFKQTLNQTFSVEYLQASMEEIDEKCGEVNDYHHVDTETLSVYPIQPLPEMVPNDDDVFSDDDSMSRADARGIPGWEKVEKLARYLTEVARNKLSLSDFEAKIVLDFYNDLDEFDKKPLCYAISKNKNFSASKSGTHRSGHVGVEHVRRCFMSAGFPAQFPSKSRVTEAMFEILMNRYPIPLQQGTTPGSRKFVSRCKLMINDYASIRHRVLNTSAFDGKLSLINVNLRTVQLWMKDRDRRDEVKTLIATQKLPAECAPESSTTAQLPPMPTASEPIPNNPMKTIEIEDQSGKAAPRGTSNMSRTTQWRLKKAMQASISSNCETPQRKKKLYSCADCDGLITDPGHGQFRGKRYCPKNLIKFHTTNGSQNSEKS